MPFLHLHGRRCGPAAAQSRGASSSPPGRSGTGAARRRAPTYGRLPSRTLAVQSAQALDTTGVVASCLGHRCTYSEAPLPEVGGTARELGGIVGEAHVLLPTEARDAHTGFMSSSRSPAQIEASRRNGQLSGGPVTPRGKLRASANGAVHGIRAERVVLAHEDPKMYAAFVEVWVTSLGPQDDAELDIAVTIADLRWRMQRLDALETNRLRGEALARADELPEVRYRHLVENAAQATTVMAEVVARPRIHGDDDLQAMLGAIRQVVDMVRTVEAERPALFLGADELADAVNMMMVLSTQDLDGDAYLDLVSRARQCTTLVHKELAVAREAAAQATQALAATVPLPDAKELSLWARYRRDLERRLESELRVLGAVRERKAQLGTLPGSLGHAVPVTIRLVS